MVKLAILSVVALCLAAAAVAGDQGPGELPWGGLVEELASDTRQAATTTATPSLSTLLINLISNIIAPLLQNIATGITNAITATFANRTLRYIPVPAPSAVEPNYRVPPRPYDDYPAFYHPQEPSKPAPLQGAEPYRRRVPSAESSEHN